MAYILIVDDDEIVAEMAADILITAGHACGWVADGENAKALLRTRRPDLLLLDHDMPGMSGTELLRELRTSPKNYDLPVIMLTRMQGSEDENAARFNGAQDYIRKPFEPDHLTWRVNNLLETRVNRPQHRSLGQHLKGQPSYARGNKRRMRAIA